MRKSIGEPKDPDVEKIMSLRLPMVILAAATNWIRVRDHPFVPFKKLAI